MDTSEQYIKMCDCPEIQDAFTHGDGSYIFSKAGGIQNMLYLKTLDGVEWGCPHSGNLPSGFIWLPRQDQLQEMVPCFTASTLPNFKLIRELNFFYDYWDTNGIPGNFNSWEQLWLAFAMKEKYNKKWKDEAWV